MRQVALAVLIQFVLQFLVLAVLQSHQLLPRPTSMPAYGFYACPYQKGFSPRFGWTCSQPRTTSLYTLFSQTGSSSPSNIILLPPPLDSVARTVPLPVVEVSTHPTPGSGAFGIPKAPDMT